MMLYPLQQPAGRSVYQSWTSSPCTQTQLERQMRWRGHSLTRATQRRERSPLPPRLLLRMLEPARTVAPQAGVWAHIYLALALRTVISVAWPVSCAWVATPWSRSCRLAAGTAL